MTTELKRSLRVSAALALTLALTACNTPAFQAGLAYGRGVSQLNAGRYEAAIESFNKALQFDSDLAVAYNDRGLAKYQLRRFDEALVDLNTAMRKNPRLGVAYNNRGLVYDATGRQKEAIADFDEALKLNPRLADTYCNRGAALLAQDKLAEAEADFARCRALGGAQKPDAEKLLLEMEGRKR